MLLLAERRAGFGFAVSSRHGGVSAGTYASLNLGHQIGDDAAAVEANRTTVAALLGVPATSVVYIHEVHGTDVVVTDAPFQDEPDADAVVTSRRGLVLAVLTADCVPVLLADPVSGVAAGAHAGRRGMVDGVVDSVLDAMVAAGADLATTSAVLGPSICGPCYEVPEALRAQVCEVLPESYAVTRQGTAAVDCAAGVRSLLSGRVGHVEDVGVCTLETPELFSRRRVPEQGQFASFVWVDR